MSVVAGEEQSTVLVLAGISAAFVATAVLVDPGAPDPVLALGGAVRGDLKNRDVGTLQELVEIQDPIRTVVRGVIPVDLWELLLDDSRQLRSICWTNAEVIHGRPTAVVVDYNASSERLLHNSPCPLLASHTTLYPTSPDDQAVIQLGVRTGRSL